MGRIFNVNAERQRRILGLDLHAEAGTGVALRKHLTVEVTDGVLDLELVPQIGEAIVSAVAVAPHQEAGR